MALNLSNYAGVLVQTGEWRRFHSLEELYVLLASFWGMNGNLGLDSFIDIFNILCATASRYVDSEGTFVRKLSLSESTPQVRELIGEYDPVIVFVDSEIEEAIRTLAGDLSALRRKYPSQNGIDWITFQYHLTLLQLDGPIGWNAPGFRMGGRIPLSVGDICQNHMAHDEFAHCHATPIRDWQRVRHMVTLRRDPAIRENYVHDAVRALAHYCQRAREASPQLEEMVMDDMMMMDYDEWLSQVDTLSEAIRSGAGVAALPDSRMEERESRAREAEAALIQSIEDEQEARARRTQRRRDKKERRSHSSTQPLHHTVILLDYQPPQEPSDEEGESVTRRLDFDEGSRAVAVREPDTPEELHHQPNQPSSPRGTSPPPDPEAMDVDAPERVEEQNQPTEGDDQAEQEPEQPPPDGDQAAGDGEQNAGEAQDSSRQPPDPPEPPPDPDDPDDPDQIPDPEEEEEEQQEEEQEEAEEGQQEEAEEGQQEEAEEEKEEEDPLQLVESESTKKSRKNKERKEKVDMAALTRLPYVLADKDRYIREP